MIINLLGKKKPKLEITYNSKLQIRKKNIIIEKGKISKEKGKSCNLTNRNIRWTAWTTNSPKLNYSIPLNGDSFSRTPASDDCWRNQSRVDKPGQLDATYILFRPCYTTCERGSTTAFFAILWKRVSRPCGPRERRTSVHLKRASLKFVWQLSNRECPLSLFRGQLDCRADGPIYVHDVFLGNSSSLRNRFSLARVQIFKF